MVEEQLSHLRGYNFLDMERLPHRKKNDLL